MSPAESPLDPQAFSEPLARLRGRIAGYTPGLRPEPGTAGAALLKVFARHRGVLSLGIDRLPERGRLAFLDTLGTGLLPARPARVPLVFELLPDSPADVTVPAGTRVAAPAAPPPASALANGSAAPAPEAAVFATGQSIVATRARLSALFSLDPASDTLADHLGCMTDGFGLFGSMEPVIHALYLGHPEHFAISGAATVRLAFHLAPYPAASVRQGLRIAWSYKAKDAWIPLDTAADATAGLTQSGEMVLSSSCGPDAATELVGGVESLWLRGLLQTPLPSEGAGGSGRLPAVDLIEARVEFSKSDLQPDAAFQDAAPLDTRNRFLPFGPRPARHGTFYLACAEAFARKGASIQVRFRLVEPVSPSGAPSLGWQYFDGEEWVGLEDQAFADTTESLTKGGSLSFRCPDDWASTKLNGTAGYWLRARLDSGDYGSPMHLAVDSSTTPATVILVEETYAPPIVESLRIAYSYLTDPTLLEHCLAENAGVYTDHSEDARWRRRLFEPFRPVEDLLPAVHLGFDRVLPAGLVSLYLQVPAGDWTEDADRLASPYVWEYRRETGWVGLAVRDETAGFRASGLIQFVPPPDALPVEGRGGSLVRLRARLKRGEPIAETPVAGLWPNAVWASHRERIERDILGTSDGSPGQSFAVLRAVGSLLEGEIVEIREWSGTGDDWETVAAEVPESDLRLETDAVSGDVAAVWVRWHGAEHLLDSGPADRRYTCERATGLLRFGDGVHGAIPPAGGLVVATYDSGGGVAGNVAPGTVRELRGGVAYLQSVSNPVAAEGGSEVETLDRVGERGPQRLRHRDRAVAAEDFEWLARETSSAVHQARCLPLKGPAGFAQRGWVSLLIAPRGPEPEPQPSPELRRQVLAHIAARCPAAIVGQVRIGGPEYARVAVVCEIVPLRSEDPAAVEARVRANLDAFLHPVTGGPEGRGWRFGESLYLSQVAQVVESETEGVDHATGLRLSLGEVMAGEAVEVGEGVLIAAGDHEIRIRLGEG